MFPGYKRHSVLRAAVGHLSVLSRGMIQSDLFLKLILVAHLEFLYFFLFSLDCKNQGPVIY